MTTLPEGQCLQRAAVAVRGISERLDGANAYAHNNLGVLLQRMGKRREEFLVATRLNPELEIARKNLEVVGGE